MASPDKTPHDCHWTEIAALQSERADKAEAEVVRLQQERDDYLRVVQAARLALDFLPATGQVSLPHRRGLEVVRAELRNALAALVVSPDKPPAAEELRREREDFHRRLA